MVQKHTFTHRETEARRCAVKSNVATFATAAAGHMASSCSVIRDSVAAVVVAHAPTFEVCLWKLMMCLRPRLAKHALISGEESAAALRAV